MPKTPSKKTNLRTRRVDFSFHAPEAKTVSLAGDFNGWDVNARPMRKGTAGTWKARLALAPGRYAYRFYADGEWRDDPSADDRVENPFGGYNCVRIVD